MADTERLTTAVTSVLDEFELELESLDVIGGGKSRKLRIVVDGDGPEGRGPLVDDIASASRAISGMLDETGLMGEQSYALELSSRGTSRPLTHPKHWRRNNGRLVRCVTADDTTVGRIARSDDEGVELTVMVNEKKGLTESVRLEYCDIDKATIEVELGRGNRSAAGSGKDS